MPKYTEEDVRLAMAEIENGASIMSTAKKYKIPRTTLNGKISGQYPVSIRKGPETVLTSEEECHLENWLLHIADAGFPATKTQLLDSVQHLVQTLNRKTPFVDGRPGRHWYEAFLKRHPQIAMRVSQNLTKARSSVTEGSIRGWFYTVNQYLERSNNLDVLDDPSRIFNMDESAFFLSPKGERVLTRKCEKAVYTFINNDEKECLTTLVAGSASGTNNLQKNAITKRNKILFLYNFRIGATTDGCIFIYSLPCCGYKCHAKRLGFWKIGKWLDDR